MDKDNAPAGTDPVDFVARVTDAALLRIEEKLPHGFVRLKVAEAERRQAQHDIRSVEDIVTEMVRNSRDAGATHVLVAFQKEQSRYRKITVLDDGCGIPADMHDMVFEPRVTSKKDDFEEDCFGVHGRGMALFSIRSRCAAAKINWSEPGRGTSVSVTVDTQAVPERADQATIPALAEEDGRESVGTGPHNVMRSLLELSVDREGTDYYVGSFAEVVAIARKLGRDGKNGPWGELAELDDARKLAEACGLRLGLRVSERNAYRVMSDEIPLLEPVYVLACGSKPVSPSPTHAERVRPKRAGGTGKNRLRTVTSEDLENIGEGARQAADRILDGYYLSTGGPARVRRGKGRITISLDVSEEEER